MRNKQQSIQKQNRIAREIDVLRSFLKDWYIAIASVDTDLKEYESLMDEYSTSRLLELHINSPKDKTMKLTRVGKGVTLKEVEND